MKKELRTRLNNETFKDLELLKKEFGYKTHQKGVEKAIELAIRFLKLK